MCGMACVYTSTYSTWGFNTWNHSPVIYVPTPTHADRSKKGLIKSWLSYMDVIFGVMEIESIFFTPKHYIPILLALYRVIFQPRWSALRWKAKT